VTDPPRRRSQPTRTNPSSGTAAAGLPSASFFGREDGIEGSGSDPSVEYTSRRSSFAMCVRFGVAEAASLSRSALGVIDERVHDEQQQGRVVDHAEHRDVAQEIERREHEGREQDDEDLRPERDARVPHEREEARDLGHHGGDDAEELHDTLVPVSRQSVAGRSAANEAA
jgi:hypothetical protein